MEREKAKTDTSGLRFSTSTSDDLNGGATPSGSRLHDERPSSSSQFQPNVPFDTAHPANDDADSLIGEAVQAVGSASSHESSSSVFSSSNAQQVSGPATLSHSTSLTPLTNIDSPSYRTSVLPTKATSLTPRHAEQPNGVNADGTPTPLSVLPSVTGRPPARDPARRVKGLKCIFDPSLNRRHPSSDTDQKPAKPIAFKDFGLVRTNTIYLAWQRGGVISSIEATG